LFSKGNGATERPHSIEMVIAEKRFSTEGG
jgi:hypothetical protein